MRAQVSVEYLVLVGIALGLLIPAILFFLTYSKTKETESVTSQINKIGLEMVATAKSTYALGQNARKTIEVVMPDAVVNVTAIGEELVISYETAAGYSEALFISTVPLVTDNANGQVSIPHSGLVNYQFDSLGTVVNITEDIS